MVGAKLSALSKEWSRSDAKQVLTCKTMRLIDFPHDEEFFERATEFDFMLELTKELGSVTRYGAEYATRYQKKSAVRHKQLLVASFTGLRELSIDVQSMVDFFGPVAELVMKWKDEGSKWKSTPTTRVHHDTNMTPCQTRWAPPAPPLNPTPSVTDRMLSSHFANLHTLELRSSATLYDLQTSHPENDGQGTLVLQGKWLNFSALKNVKYHGEEFPADFIRLFLRTCLAASISLNSWQCQSTHPDFAHHFASQRPEFHNTITTFSWKNMEPCPSVLATTQQLLMTQCKSLKTLSLVRTRRERDRQRFHEVFASGSVRTVELENLEYLDIEARFLIPTQGVTTAAECFTWLNLPRSIQTLSIDAITESESVYTKRYLISLLTALRGGHFPELKEVRCGFVSIQGSGIRVDPWKCFGNLPGKFLGARGITKIGVWLKEWEYDWEEVEDEEVEDTVASRIAARLAARHRPNAPRY